MNAESCVDAVIVGAGISGLTAAWEYIKRAPGARVRVCEAQPDIGGLLKGSALGGAVDSADVGAEASLYVRPETRELAAELGLECVYPSREHASQLYAGGAMHAMPRGTLMGVPGDPEVLRGILADADVERIAREELTPAGEGDIAVGEFLAARLGDAVVDTVIDPLIGGVYSGRCRDLSMAATVPALLPAYREGTSVRAAVEQTLAARSQASGANIPGTQSRQAPPVFMSLAGGINQLIRALAAALADRGVDIRTHTPVTAVAPGDGGWWVTAGERLWCHRLVLAVPAYRAAELLAQCAPRIAQPLAAVPYADSAVVTAVLDTASPLTGSGFLVPHTEGRFIKASTYASNKWPWLAAVLPAGRAVVRMSVGRFGDAPEVWAELDDAELARRAWEDWCDITRRADTLVHIEVQRWMRGLPQFTPGCFVRTADIDRAASEMPGLGLVGSVYEGVGLPMCIRRSRSEITRLLGPAEQTQKQTSSGAEKKG